MGTNVRENKFSTYITRSYMKPRENLVTVCGHNTTMLHHMLRHYQYNVKEIFVVLYAHHKDDPVIEEGKQILEKFNLKPHKIVY